MILPLVFILTLNQGAYGVQYALMIQDDSGLNFSSSAVGTTPLVDDTWYVMTKNMFSIWAVFMLPLLCSSVTALWANFEHQADQWKYLFALPFPRRSFRCSKSDPLDSASFTLLNCAKISIFTSLLTTTLPASVNPFHRSP